MNRSLVAIVAAGVLMPTFALAQCVNPAPETASDTLQGAWNAFDEVDTLTIDLPGSFPTTGYVTMRLDAVNEDVGPRIIVNAVGGTGGAIVVAQRSADDISETSTTFEVTAGQSLFVELSQWFPVTEPNDYTFTWS